MLNEFYDKVSADSFDCNLCEYGAVLYQWNQVFFVYPQGKFKSGIKLTR